LKEISDDEAVEDELEEDDDLLTKVLHDNDLQLTENESHSLQIKSISNNIEPVHSGTNVFKVEEYEQDSSDEEVLDTKYSKYYL